MSESEILQDEEQGALVSEYVALRAEAESDRKAKRKLGRVEKKLDNFYWKRVEEIVVGQVASDSETLDFQAEERLLIDAGLLDLALIPNAPDDLADQLLAELNASGAANHFYLSEWIEDRYRRFRLTEDVSAAMQAAEHREGPVDEGARERRQLLDRVGPFFAGLPGVGRELAGHVAEGRLDDQILKISMALLTRPQRKLFKYRRRLCSLRSQVLQKARARASDQASLKAFDALEALYAKDWRKRYQEARSESGLASGEQESEIGNLNEDRAAEYLRGELRFVKTLMPLGALAGGVSRTCAVLLENGSRVRKSDTAAALARAAAYDRGYAVDPVVLIAPFKGRGIFEWDRNSLVVSLVPVDSAADSVANAAGNYRMLIDSQQQDGVLRNAYETAFPDAQFQQAFQADYRAWINRVGQGDADGLPPEKKAFFRQHIGPDLESLPAPANLRNLGPQTRALLRKRLEKQIAIGKPSSSMHHRLAVLCWQDGDTPGALAHMATAAKLAPNAGVLLFSLGLLLRREGRDGQTKATFDACRERAAQTLWAVYASEALNAMR